MDRVKNKVAIVTGSAGGLGEAQALTLAREGAKVCLTDINDSVGDNIAHTIRNEGGEAFYLNQDVTDEQRWHDVMQKVVETYGRVDILVNNAGIALYASLEETTLEAWQHIHHINSESVFLGTKIAIQYMKEQTPKGGSIINISSVAGLVGAPNLAAYSASKGGVRLFTKSAALHCARADYNIRVNSVHPSYIWTPMVQAIGDQMGNRNALKESINDAHPMGRMGTPMDIAWAIIYLASDESAWVTGTELIIDGGLTAQ